MENSYLTRSGKALCLSCSLFLFCPACEEQTVTENFASTVEGVASEGLYQSLAGKMARMEELLNSIERFLGESGFEDRLQTEAKEFHQLLAESQTIYPEELAEKDRKGYRLAYQPTLEASARLKASLAKNDLLSAREAITELHRLRKKAHARYSY